LIVSGRGIVDWISERTGDDFPSKTVGIGEWRDSRIIAGASFADYNGINVVSAIAIDEPPTRGFYHAIFEYPFEQLGCKRITALVEESNTRSVALTKKLGFEVEARMEGAAHDGGDYLVMRMLKENCKQLDWRKRNG
jgi:RimJ/RimL family protein N-acetyltransferase